MVYPLQERRCPPMNCQRIQDLRPLGNSPTSGTARGPQLEPSRRRFAIAGAILLSLLTVAGLEAQTSPVPDLQLGRKVFRQACVECHGAKGRGDGAKAKKLGFHPRDLTYGVFKCQCTPTGELPTDDDLFRTVTSGLLGTPMVGHGSTLSEDERWAVVGFIKTLSPRFESGNLPRCPPPPSPPPPSPALVAEGKQIYRLMECARCHGASGRGDGPAAASLLDDWGEPIKPYNFLLRKDFKCGSDDRDLYRTLRTGLTGTPMPSYEAALAFARDDFTPEGLALLAAAPELAELETYVTSLPDRASFQGMSSEAHDKMIVSRTYALVQFLRSMLGR